MPDLPDAHVIETDHLRFKVRPGVAAVRRDAGFDLRNVTNWWATLQFPRGILVPDERLSADLELLRKLFPGEVTDLLVNTIRWVGPRETIHLEFAGGVEGVYEYAVTLVTDRGPVDASGDSAPKVIIDP